MNVVGKVGSLITQGVYSVATPFHPFGGAVDIIVVQQQDGSFRSTPWYVQFGKFQGVLKGAEKVVRIKVNGVESNFHMNLDNSGEAYFVRDADFCQSVDQKHVLKDPCLEHSFSVDNSQCTSNITNDDNVDNFKLQSTLSDPGILRDEYSSFNRLERADSDACRFYDFQDDQSFDDSVELSSDYGSSRYDTMEAVESFVEAQGSDSEMVLVSVDGHILTAPISSSEQNAEIMQLDTPQFHLGPGKGNGFCQEEREFSVTETTWDSEYLNDLESSSTKPDSDIRNANNNADSNVSSDNHVIIEENAYQDRGGDGSSIQQSEGFDDRRKLLSPESSNGEPIQGIINTSVECDDSRESGFSGEGIGDNYEVEAGGDVEHIYEDDGVEHNHLPQGLDEDPTTQHSRSSSEQSEEDENPTLEISLCRHLLRPGMGLSAADEAFNAHRLSEEEFRSTLSSILKNENLVIRYHKKYLPWNKAVPIVLGKAVFGLNLPVECEDAITVEEEVTSNLEIQDSGSTSGRRWRLWPIPFRRGKTFERSTTNTSEEVFVDSESVSRSPSADLTPLVDNGTPLSEASPKFGFKKIVRTNIPTNEQISALNLKEGQNDVTFSFSTRVLGLQQVEAHIYLWKWNARIVISDVDGTITRSDVLGQFMPLVGKDWSQSGVARLFSAIKENGYQLLFLSARAIVQAYLTKSFLFNLKQDGKSLPNGPVVISPNGLFPSLFREVIRRAPHEFKIACLEDIKALFPPDYNPFYAGFGNRDTDELTYRKIGIPKGKIFIINPKGEVAINHRIDVKSYTSLHTLVNDMFPPSMVEQEDFNAWNYWKMPLPDIVD